MKRSRYVVETEGAQGELLLYNTSNGAFAQVSPEMRQIWERAGAGDAGQACEAVAFQGGSEDAVRELVRTGMLTGLSPEEELARQQMLFDAERADSSHLTMSFIPTYVCNFRCPYCYEIGHNKVKGKMDAHVMDAIEAFVEFKYEQDDFKRMTVQWYGGDPSLALDEVEELSRRLIDWADGHGVSYDAMMLTNANTIDAHAADLIARCRISLAYLTIDGPEEIHNQRRVAANGSNSYERTIEAARLLRARGIALLATMNTDKVNIAYYEGLRQRLLEDEGIELGMAKLNDYGHFYGQAPFCAPDFDLYEHEEFFQAQFAEFAKRAHDTGEMREMLRPIRRFCTGQYDNYFIIDLLGDVYRCDGRVGEKGHVQFNLFDDKSTWKLDAITFDATRDEKCSACELLPVCQGNCIWERECSGMPCHPFKTTIGDYLKLYQACFDAEADSCCEHGVMVLAEPFSNAELGLS